jgi:hypothetical protein
MKDVLYPSPTSRMLAVRNISIRKARCRCGFSFRITFLLILPQGASLLEREEPEQHTLNHHLCHFERSEKSLAEEMRRFLAVLGMTSRFT